MPVTNMLRLVKHLHCDISIVAPVDLPNATPARSPAAFFVHHLQFVGMLVSKRMHVSRLRKPPLELGEGWKLAPEISRNIKNSRSYARLHQPLVVSVVPPPAKGTKVNIGDALFIVSPFDCIPF
jgi:hypothetical protein